jgi:hypothetical protein
MVEIDSVATIIDTSETVRMIISIAVTRDPKRHRRYSPRSFILAASHSAARTCNQSTGEGLHLYCLILIGLAVFEPVGPAMTVI